MPTEADSQTLSQEKALHVLIGGRKHFRRVMIIGANFETVEPFWLS